ncbi:MAG: Uma2 family endonuclease [Blastocatellia bacterium]
MNKHGEFIMGAAQPLSSYSLAEYLAYEERIDDRHEFLAGQIYAMAGGSPEHNRICFNLGVSVGRRLTGSACHGYSPDQRIWIAEAELSTYADLTIVCGEPQFHAQYRSLLLNPRVIFEVLSPGTAAYDRGEKWGLYQLLPSLTDYVLISQHTSQIEHYVLEADGSWRYKRETDGAIRLDAIHAGLPFAEIYDGLVFPSPTLTRPPIRIVPE